MTKDQIIAELKAERSKLQHAITVLEGGSEGIRRTRASIFRQTSPTHHQMTPQGRKRLSEMMKKRWAERRKQGMRVIRKAA